MASCRRVSWRIVPFDPALPGQQDGVIALISGIQRGEFQLPITPADQPDLMDIPGFYVKGALGPGCFFVAVDESDEAGLIAGSIALLNIGPAGDGVGQGALRKMFVRADARGSGLAAQLLAALEAWCGANGVARIFLGTTDRFLAAHRFYEKHSFTRVEKDSLPATFPVMSVDTVFYAKTLYAKIRVSI
ncbi:MAG TPA: GNAT family N-acetyltransferase [Humidesulfovibrio sp.]|uniref:GNAT family N-acetyltransferase n=1 Tax=Humidesulfovibrio sp. TaxID=2910988 RepID=UPI002C3D4B07|nr:GNAT family N-acetyltransferase [Humidesulfovibrio sp.]HWR02898.1 GNAT family N-acetyltransferase [Humidesulfovibrio sp.]